MNSFHSRLAHSVHSPVAHSLLWGGVAGQHSGAVQAIRASLQAGDLEQARRQAHTLKGAAATIGADALTSAARALEPVILQNDSAQLPARLDQLDSELARLLSAIASYTP